MITGVAVDDKDEENWSPSKSSAQRSGSSGGHPTGASGKRTPCRRAGRRLVSRWGKCTAAMLYFVYFL